MKTKLKRVLSMMLAAAMCLSLAACGDKDETESAKTLADELGFGYLSSYQDVDVDINWIGSVSTAQGKLYFSGDYYDEVNQINSTKLYEMDPVTGSIQEIPIPQLENSDSVNEYIQSLAICSDGSGYWIACERYVYSATEDAGVMPMEDAEAVTEETGEGDQLMEPEAETTEGDNQPDTDEVNTDDAGLSEGAHVEMLSASSGAVAVPLPDTSGEFAAADGDTVDGETAESDNAASADDETTGEDVTDDENIDDYTYVEPEESSYARKVDMSGNVIQEIDLNAIKEEMDYFYPSNIAQSGDGYLYIGSDNAIVVFDAEGNHKDTITVESGWIQSMATTENGGVLVSYYSYTDANDDSNGNLLSLLESGVLSDPLKIDGLSALNNMTVFSGAGDSILVNDGDFLYELDTKNQTASKLLSWLDCDINGNYISGIAATSEDNITVLTVEYGDTVRYELGTLTKTPADEMPQRTILTFGAVYMDDVIRKAVINFNRNSDTYRVTMVDYSEYNTTEDYSLGTQQLERDIISGNCPDIVSLSSGHEDRFISKGALADLTALIDKDDSFSMDDLVTGALNQYIVDGKLYALPTSFNLELLVASAKLIGDRDGWNMNEMSEIIQNLPDGVDVMQSTSQGYFVTLMIRQNLDTFVDYGKATCNFETPEFEELLKAASALPSEEEMEKQNDAEMYSMMNGTYVYTDPMQLIQSGDMLMNGLYMAGDYSLRELYNMYTTENGFNVIGYPVSEGNGAKISTDNALAISAKSRHQEGAWEFLKSLTDDKVQKEVYSFPISQARFDTVMEESMENPYYMDGDEKVYYSNYGYIGDTEIEMKPLTQEQVDDFKAMVAGASVGGTYDEDIMEIIQDEVGAYFSGDKTAAEVEALIQNRVTIYLGETS